MLCIYLLSIDAPAFAGITGSMHDLSGWSWTEGEICVVCHTPHNASGSIAPLWNHATTTTTFTPYSSSTLNASVGVPSASSKACLSCHDGTVAVNSFGGKTGTKFVRHTNTLDPNLKNDHPVSFVYDSALSNADGALEDPATKTVAPLGGKTIDAAMLINHKLECSSCHDVHATKGASATADYLLIVDYENSELCRTCHKK